MGSPSFTPALWRTQTTHDKEKEMEVLSLSSNQEKFRYENRKNIFGRFSNSMDKIMLEMVWLSFGIIGGFLAHEMIGGV